MNDTQLTAIIIGITGLIRTRLPRVDGLVVPIVAMVLGGSLGAFGSPDGWREALVHGVGVALAAIGGMTALGYAGSKIGAGLASGADSAGAPAASPPAASPTAEHPADG
ncbi:MAG: hypothetical protein IT374_20270 [Polyangiaceae bacterium]|nr:hypothetical protein [Polyangiaceae bacterium]